MGLVDLWYERRWLIALAATIVAAGGGLYLLLGGEGEDASVSVTSAATGIAPGEQGESGAGSGGTEDPAGTSDPRCAAVAANEPGVERADLKGCESQPIKREIEPQAELGPQEDSSVPERGTQPPIDGPVDSTPDDPGRRHSQPDLRYPQPELRDFDRQALRDAAQNTDDLRDRGRRRR